MLYLIQFTELDTRHIFPQRREESFCQEIGRSNFQIEETLEFLETEYLNQYYLFKNNKSPICSDCIIAANEIEI